MSKVMLDAPENVFLLSIDALRADHLSCYGYHRTTTPNIDRVARENAVFTRAYSASSHTREAVPSLLTGEYPDRAVDDRYHLASDSIAARLRAAGFDTAAFHSNPFLSRAYGYDAGFDTFDDDLSLGGYKLAALVQRALDKLRNRHYAPASEINERALDWIDSTNGPRFLWNHYMDSHGPYEPPATYVSAFRDPDIQRDERELYQRAIRNPASITDDERSLLVDLYDAEIRYTDHHVGAFVDALKERGLYGDSLVIVTADHGDAFGEHGYYEHPRYLDEELLHVPLVVSMARGQATGKVDTPVSLLGLAPFVSNRIDAEWSTTDQPWMRALERPTEDRIVFAQASGEDDHAHQRRFAARSLHERARAIFDIRRESIEITEATTEAISERLHQHVTRRVERTDQSTRAHDLQNDEIENRLTALGYKE